MIQHRYRIAPLEVDPAEADPLYSRSFDIQQAELEMSADDGEGNAGLALRSDHDRRTADTIADRPYNLY